MEAKGILLLATLAAPLVVTAAALSARTPSAGRKVFRAGCGLTAVGWAALTALGPVAEAGLHTSPLLSAAACGAALLSASVEEPADLYSILGGGVALLALSGGLSFGTTDDMGWPEVAGLALAAACTNVAAWDRRDGQVQMSALAAAGGIVAATAGLVLVHRSTGQWELATDGSQAISRGAFIALLTAGAALGIAGGLRPRRSTGVLLAGGLAVGLVTAPLRGVAVLQGLPMASQGVVGLAAGLAVVALVAVAARRAALALALLSLAAAAGPIGCTAASRLLAAAAVIVLAVDERASWLTGVPGGVALAVVAIDLGSDEAVGLAAVAAGVAGLLAWVASTPHGQARSRRSVVRALPAVAAGAWLFVAPGSWRWVGPAGLGPYDMGAARAAALGLIVVVAFAIWEETMRGRGVDRRQERPPGPPVEPPFVEPPPPSPGNAPRPKRVKTRAREKSRGLP